MEDTAIFSRDSTGQCGFGSDRSVTSKPTLSCAILQNYWRWEITLICSVPSSQNSSDDGGLIQNLKT